jgi:hypothetical protein
MSKKIVEMEIGNFINPVEIELEKETETKEWKISENINLIDELRSDNLPVN